MKGKSRIGSLEIQRYASFEAQNGGLQVSETQNYIKIMSNAFLTQKFQIKKPYSSKVKGISSILIIFYTLYSELSIITGIINRLKCIKSRFSLKDTYTLTYIVLKQSYYC